MLSLTNPDYPMPGREPALVITRDDAFHAALIMALPRGTSTFRDKTGEVFDVRSASLLCIDGHLDPADADTFASIEDWSERMIRSTLRASSLAPASVRFLRSLNLRVQPGLPMPPIVLFFLPTRSEEVIKTLRGLGADCVFSRRTDLSALAIPHAIEDVRRQRDAGAEK